MCALSLREEIMKNPKNEKISIRLDPRELITYPQTSALRDIFLEIQISNLTALFRGSNFVTLSMVGLWNLVISYYNTERLDYHSFDFSEYETKVIIV